MTLLSNFKVINVWSGGINSLKPGFSQQYFSPPPETLKNPVSSHQECLQSWDISSVRSPIYPKIYKLGLDTTPTLHLILQSAEADFVCVVAVSTAES